MRRLHYPCPRGYPVATFFVYDMFVFQPSSGQWGGCPDRATDFADGKTFVINMLQWDVLATA